MIHQSRVSTHAAHAGSRMSLVRDTAFNLFNLEVDLGDAEPPCVSADIRVARSTLASMIDVTTSWSTVMRTKARARAAASGNVLVYLIHQGGSWFENGDGARGREIPAQVIKIGREQPVERRVRRHALDGPSMVAALKSLDHLLSAALGDERAHEAGLAGTVAGERYRAALAGRWPPKCGASAWSAPCSCCRPAP